MENFINDALKNRNLKNTILVVSISFIHFLLSLPISLLPFTHLGDNDIKAFWQPPGYIFGIVWSILYVLLGIVNLYTFYSDQITIKCKSKIIEQSIWESLGQVLWLLAYGKFIYNPETFDRFVIQYYLSTFVITGLMIYAWIIRLPAIWKCTNELDNNDLSQEK